MENEEKKPVSPQKKNYKKYRTGEDVDMLNERYTDPEGGNWGSSKYKDHIDGA